MMKSKNIFLVLSLITISYIFAMDKELILSKDQHQELSQVVSSVLVQKDIGKKEEIIKTIHLLQEFNIPLSLCGAISFDQYYVKNESSLKLCEYDEEFDIYLKHKIDTSKTFYNTACHAFMSDYKDKLEYLVHQHMIKQSAQDKPKSYFDKKQVALKIEQEAHKIMLKLLDK